MAAIQEMNEKKDTFMAGKASQKLKDFIHKIIVI